MAWELFHNPPTSLSLLRVKGGPSMLSAGCPNHASQADFLPALPSWFRRAMSGRKQVQQCWCSRANLFDHLVGKREEILRHFEAKRLGRI